MPHQIQEHEHPFNHRGQLLAFILFLIVWIGDSFFLNISTFFAESVPLWIRLMVLTLSIILIVSLFKSVITIFSEEETSDDVIVSGAFKYVRHPMYFACILFYFGLAFSTLSLFSFALIFPIFLFYNHIATFEEKFLISKYGKSYLQYMKETYRWIPKIKRGQG